MTLREDKAHRSAHELAGEVGITCLSGIAQTNEQNLNFCRSRFYLVAQSPE